MDDNDLNSANRASVRSKLTLACVSIALLLPFALREGLLPLQTEPYPAVLFPRGNVILQLDEQSLALVRQELFSVDANGVEHKLPRAEFIHPIPTHYFSYIVSSIKKFGLATEEHKPIKFGSGSWQVVAKPRRSSTNKEKREVVKWLSERLRVVGRPLDRTIIVRSTTVQIDIATGDEVNSEINSQYDINLDDYSS